MADLKEIQKKSLDRKKRDFLTDFHYLIERHNAELFYTTDDDGIHIAIGSDEIFVGWLNGFSNDLENEIKKFSP